MSTPFLKLFGFFLLEMLEPFQGNRLRQEKYFG